MGTSLFVMIPLVLLGLVAALSFVGCVLQSGGVDLVGPYQDSVLNDPNIVAFWPLNDQSDSPNTVNGAPAKDFGPNKFNGTYVAPTVGSVMLNQQRIVPGDVATGTSTPSTCAKFNGGFVQVGFQSLLNPSSSFSIEAWAQPEQLPGSVMIVVASDDLNLITGYQLHVTAENHWAAAVGNGTNFAIAKPPTASAATAKVGESTYLVATFDSTTGTLTLFVDGAMSAQATIMAPPSFQPALNPTQFSIGVTGAGTQPQFPFNGEIQDVAFYKTVLDGATIMKRFNLGSA